MNLFTIRDIENLSGIKAHTWRIWEQRYGMGLAQRKDSNHRFFDNNNLKEVLRIAYLYHSGVKISKIVNLDAARLKDLALSKVPKENVNDFYIKELMEAAIDLDEDRFEFTFNKALETMEMEELILNILYPYQKKLGMLWLTDHIIPAQEHFTSSVITRKLLVAIDQLPGVKNTEKKKVILFTPEQEQHELPLLFIHYLLKKSGNKVIYFGSNVPLSSIEIGMPGNSFTHIWFHLITNFISNNIGDYMEAISKQFPEKEIFMSGPQVKRVTHTLQNIRLISSMEEIVSCAKE